MRRHLFITTWLMAWLIAAGCTTWSATENPTVPRLPMAQMSRDSIGIEVATVTLQPDQLRFLPDIFSRLDEQVLDHERRDRLMKNGFRAGVLGVNLPEPVSFLLMEASDRSRHPTAESQHFEDEQRFSQCRAKKSSIAKIWGQRNLAVHYDNGEFASAVDFPNAQSLIRIYGEPHGSSSATIRLVPGIKHGPMRQKFVVQDNAFHMEARRDEKAYDELAMNISLRPGEVLMVTCDATSPHSLGRQFFVNGKWQKLLLIRLAQTQMDELFESEF